jgi:hypothetical protein
LEEALSIKLSAETLSSPDHVENAFPLIPFGYDFLKRTSASKSNLLLIDVDLPSGRGKNPCVHG